MNEEVVAKMMMEVIMKTTRSKLVSKIGMAMNKEKIEVVGQVSMMLNAINVETWPLCE